MDQREEPHMNHKFWKVLFVLIFLSISCELPYDNIIGISTLFTHQIDRHRSTPEIEVLVDGRTGIIAKANFRKAQYEHEPTLDGEQRDWNKLIGFTDCGNFVAFKGHGAMLGWRWNPEEQVIQLAAYTHNKIGAHHSKRFDKIEIKEGDQIEIEIWAGEEVYNYRLKNLETNEVQEIKMEENSGRGCRGPIDGKFIQPWFGGDLPAPELIEIDLEVLE